MKIKYNYTMMCDFYELTMANGYFVSGLKDQISYFDGFYRTTPDNGGYTICAGLEQVIDYINDLHFDEEDIEYLRGKGIFDAGFLEYLKNFKFSGSIWAIPEGTPVFPYEPIITVKANAIEAQLIETYVLSELNHQTLIATKAARIVKAAEGRLVSEFGARRAHGAEAATLGARAAYIAGCASTSCTLTDLTYHAPASGTMAHSWVQMFGSEYEAFVKYCEIYPSAALLLVDTYDVIKSGIPNAIKAFNNILKPLGKRPLGIRIDSGDIAYLTKKVRKMLDEAGYEDAKIFVSNSLDEYLIHQLLYQGAKIDAFGVGERLITSKSDPVLDGVYKLAAIEENGIIIPKIKVSENIEKITNPCYKRVYRLYDKDTKKAEADYIAVYDEDVLSQTELKLFDPHATWKTKIFDNVYIKELQVPIFLKGVQVYKTPDIQEIREYCAEQISLLWDEVKRFEHPHNYYVDLSDKLWKIRNDLVLANRNTTFYK